MTISPPANVMSEECRVLASGVDTLYVSFDLMWEQTDFLDLLRDVKERAVENEREGELWLGVGEGKDGWAANVKPFGVQGYEWLLTSADFNIRIGNWLEPSSRPSARVEISSEALWRMGVETVCSRVVRIFQTAGASIIRRLVSRADLCVDVLIPEGVWSSSLLDYAVTRARYTAAHRENGKLTGLSIGKGAIGARLYDKPEEIRAQSGKVWMYKVWRIEEVPEGKRVIRVEFQLRREALKSLGLDTVEDFQNGAEGAWAYCTQKWLKFQSRPGEHANLRETFPWWQVIQEAFARGQKGTPLIRAEAVNWERDQLESQVLGLLGSLVGSELCESNKNLEELSDRDIRKVFDRIVLHVKGRGKRRGDLETGIRRKIAKYQRGRAKYGEAQRQRESVNSEGKGE